MMIEPDDPEVVILELDELWSFVRHKVNRRWVWLALCKFTRQVVACVPRGHSMIGGRGEATCKLLWPSVPKAYKQGVCYTDFWKAHLAVIPETQHRAVGKDTDLTNHVEHFNNTLRQRLSRFVRETLSFSKSDYTHLICLHLFLFRYNIERVAVY